MSARKIDNFRNEDFIVLNEDFSRWQLEDGTVIKGKIVLRKLLFSILKAPDGHPRNYGFESMDAVSAIVPKKLKKRQQGQRFDLNKDVGTDVEFQEQEIHEQTYMTSSGFKFKIKPVATRIQKYKKYNELDEPIYYVNFQAITNLIKMKKSQKQ